MGDHDFTVSEVKPFTIKAGTVTSADYRLKLVTVNGKGYTPNTIPTYKSLYMHKKNIADKSIGHPLVHRNKIKAL